MYNKICQHLETRTVVFYTLLIYDKAIACWKLNIDLSH